MKKYLLISQIFVAIFLIISILLQKRGSAFGGGFYLTRRGIEKKIFLLTCILGVVFVILALLNLII